MDTDRIITAPAYVFSADLVGGAEVTLTQAEAWSSLATIVSVALFAAITIGGAVWLAAVNV